MTPDDWNDPERRQRLSESAWPVPKPVTTLRKPKRLSTKLRGVPPALKRQVLERDDYTCRWCKVRGGALDPHHILPRGRGGKDTLDNLASLHRQCHRHCHEHPLDAIAAGLLA